MFVIRAGKLAITKQKGSSEIVLAELGPGDMVGEMAFFDGKPRSATGRAVNDLQVIELPFRALHSQFNSFPEWLKAIVKALNTHLRNANLKIKNLEKSTEEEVLVFPPHLVTRLCGILSLIAQAFGEKNPNGPGVLLPPNKLRIYTIQIFQQPTNKMQTMMEVLQGFGHMKIEDLGEGKQRISLFNPDFLSSFVDFYNDYLFKSEDKRVTVEEKEMKVIKALLLFAKKGDPPDSNGFVTVNLTQMQNESMRELGSLVQADDVNSLSEKKLTTEKMSKDGVMTVRIRPSELEQLHPYWELIHALRKMKKD